MQDLESCYHSMLLIRRFEEKSGQLYGMGKIAGFCHLYVGQEAVVIGIQSALQEGDKTITSYRDHGHIIAAGADINTVAAELMGKATGCSKGKGGSMHMFAPEKHFYGGHGIVGAQVPIGTGLAFADKYKGRNNITVTYMGDGGVNQGQVYESFNMASLWKLPVLYIIENNEYAMGTSVNRSSSEPDLFKRGLSFRIPGKQIDGMNVIEVREEAKKAVEFIRSGNGPMILEAKTYRYRGHSMSDPAKYREKEEVEKYKNIDPIVQLKKYMLDHKIVSESWFEECANQVKKAVSDAVNFAENSPYPALDELYKDIFKEDM